MVFETVKVAMKFLFKRPYTRMVPKSHYPFKTENLRGRHVLDMSKCIGCTMCQQVCPANAIDMVEVEGEWRQNPRKRFPRIDLHKCTYCGLCVEYCPTGALSMTTYTGFELYTRDKSTLLHTPLMLSKKPVNARSTITKDKFFLEVKMVGVERMFKAVKTARELVL